MAIVYGGLDMWILSGENELTTIAAISCGMGTANLLTAAAVAKLRDMM